ncbi:MAG: ArsI/CadI family heavy metal resistance metalloenzyme [Betaproteobacteria bacterium]
MKRFHVHVAVDDLDANIRFYSTVFGLPPTVVKSDYIKWMLEDPRVNFAISKRGLKLGIDHLGVQVDTDEELALMREHVGSAEIAARDQLGAACCYARSDKYWITDPQGIAWETFRTLDSVPVYGDVERPSAATSEQKSACCAPAGAKTLVTESAKKSGACC